MKEIPADSPSEYVAGLNGWRRSTVESLRRAVRAEKRLEETIKWGHIVYSHNGPALLIRAQPDRVLFGFWRGKRLVDIESRLTASGDYEMAAIALTKKATLKPAVARRLATAAADLNETLGDPRDDAKKKRSRRETTRSRS